MTLPGISRWPILVIALLLSGALNGPVQAGVIRGIVRLCADSNCSGGMASSSFFFNIYVRLDPVTPVRYVRFSIDLPPCLNASAISFGPTATLIGGDVESGIELDLGRCYTTPVELGVLTVVNGQVGPCCQVVVRPHPAALSGRIEGTDCLGNVVLLTAWNTTINYGGGSCGAPTVPYSPYPVDGALVEAADVILDWDTGPTASGGLGQQYIFKLYGGTDPGQLAEWAPWDGGFTFDPPPLEAGTTYYWRVLAIDTDFSSTLGPIWSFATTGTTPVQSSTWGSVKALYRDPHE